MSVIESAEIGARIRKALLASSLSASELGRLMGESRQAVHSWCKTGRISKKKLKEVAELLGQSYDFFLGIEEMTSREKEEWDLLQSFRALTKGQKRLLKEHVDLLAKERRKAAKTKV